MTVANDTQEPPRPKLRGPQFRRRSHLTMTVHPDTIVRMAMLTNHYKLPVGQVVDKLVSSLARCFDSEGKTLLLTCIHGEACRMARQDVPQVL